MEDELKRRRIVKALQRECMNLQGLADTLESNLRNKPRNKFYPFKPQLVRASLDPSSV